MNHPFPHIIAKALNNQRPRAISERENSSPRPESIIVTIEKYNP